MSLLEGHNIFDPLSPLTFKLLCLASQLIQRAQYYSSLKCIILRLHESSNILKNTPQNFINLSQRFSMVPHNFFIKKQNIKIHFPFLLPPFCILFFPSTHQHDVVLMAKLSNSVSGIISLEVKRKWSNYAPQTMYIKQPGKTAISKLAQKSVRWLVKYILLFLKTVQNETLHIWHTTPYYCSTNWLAGLNLNFYINVREYFRLTGFWSTLYNPQFWTSLESPHHLISYWPVHFPHNFIFSNIHIILSFSAMENISHLYMKTYLHSFFVYFNLFIFHSGF
jgi:hypothetical protein